ncbi:hypothetical protein Pan258_54610 [Symmachiella dynata]|uniref:hypothetical protein n=1 Tax=Symmachiella dynata TaxID=2527995 RepID=UPI0011899AE1|nr:hypothetical protein [Symmachiella dynata]QDT51372.1 hypothetical protein Pan258_54610 [Symmachiella dynata]
MSKTLFVEYRNAGFWAIDVASSVFLKFLIDEANEYYSQKTDDWLNDAISNWCMNTVLSDLGFHLNDDWSQSQLDTVITLCRTTSTNIRTTGDIPAREVASWSVIDDLEICTRGFNPIPCEPVARFGDAVADLLNNTLPEAPYGHWWFYTLDNEVRTIAKRNEQSS